VDYTGTSENHSVCFENCSAAYGGAIFVNIIEDNSSFAGHFMLTVCLQPQRKLICLNLVRQILGSLFLLILLIFTIFF
jgi:hypothetical protein